MDRADIKLGFLLAYVLAIALHAVLAAAILRRRRPGFELKVFAGANLALALWHGLQLMEFVQNARLRVLGDGFLRLLTGGQLLLGMIVLALFFHLFATFERRYRRRAPSLRAAITGHVHRHQAHYVRAVYLLVLVGLLLYLSDAGGVSRFLAALREAIGPTSAYLFGGTLLFMTFVLFPARAGQEKILVAALGRGLLLLSLGLTLGLLALWHDTHLQRTLLVLMPWLHLHSVAFCVFLALVRYELPFMDRYISAGLRVLSWSVVVLAAYYVFNRLRFMDAQWGRYATSMGKIAILLAAVGLAPWMGRQIAGWSDRVLFLRKRDLRQAGESLARRIAASASLRALVDEVGQEIAGTVQARKVHIAIGRTQEVEEALSGKLAYRLRLPLGSGPTPPGWLLLGERRNLYPYFTGERRYLRLAAGLLGAAIPRLRALETTPSSPRRVRGEEKDEREALRRRVAELEGELKRVRRELRERSACFSPELMGQLLAIANEVAERDATAALSILDRLEAVHAYAQGSDAQPVALAEEMEFAQNVLALEKLRRRNRLDVSLGYDPRLQRQEILRGALQPLLQNAMQHGLDKELRRGRIEVHATEEEGRCRVRVEDNGAGLAAVYDLTRAPRDGGLFRLLARLRERYGDEAGLRLEPTGGDGARATVELPRRDLPRRSSSAA